MGDDVTNVAKPRHVHHRALEAQSKTGMRHSAVFAQVAVPPIVLGVEVVVANALFQHVQTILTLRATDDLSNAGTMTSIARTVWPSSLGYM